MTKRNANINPEILIWARKAVKLTIDLASDKIGVKPEKLEAWESGIEQPTFKQLYKISEVYKRPFALFYFPKPPIHFKPLKDFRRFTQLLILTENDEYQLQKELLLFQRKREIALELYDVLGEEIPKFQLTANQYESAEIVSKRIIDHLQINHNEISDREPGYDALNYWKNFLESKGIFVFQTTRVPLHVMRGACIAKEDIPVIIINSNDSQNGRIFSLFHELVHIVLQDDSISNFRFSEQKFFDNIEVFCNRIAAEILVPSELILNNEIVKTHDPETMIWTFNELNKIARRFCVSQEVILRRLLTLNRTNNTFYQDYRANQVINKKSKPSGGDYYRNIIAKNGQLFLNLALQGYYQEKLTASSLADFLQIKISNVTKLENKLYAKVSY